MKQVEIFFKDLSKEKQEEVVRVSGVDWMETTNWDVMPLAIVHFSAPFEGKSNKLQGGK
jgi:hypothetical protein